MNMEGTRGHAQAPRFVSADRSWSRSSQEGYELQEQTLYINTFWLSLCSAFLNSASIRGVLGPH